MIPRLNSKEVIAPLTRLILVSAFLLSQFSILAQTKKRVDIEHASYWEANEQIAPNAQRLIGDVRIRHQDILMWCDSAYTYTGTNRVDAFGNVHINQGDTIDLYANKIILVGV